MRIFLDESGNTGCIISRNNALTFKQQPTFSLGAVCVETQKDEEDLIQKYLKFKEHFKITGEIKGSNLTKRENNDKLDYLIENIVDDRHFYVHLYDKRFYLASLLLTALIGREFMEHYPVPFYQIVSGLSFQNDDFFIYYCDFIKQPTLEKYSQYLDFLLKYKYKFIEVEICSMFLKVVKQAKDSSDKKEHLDDFMTYGWYDDNKITNLINLTALGELIGFIPTSPNSKDNEYFHDNIKEFSKTLSEELKPLNVKIQFPDSKQSILIQLADNIASIVRHCYDKMHRNFMEHKEWLDENEWIMETSARLFNKITSNHIKWTVPLPDWAAALCVMEMFEEKYPKIYRKNYYFNSYYQRYLSVIYKWVDNNRISDIE